MRSERSSSTEAETSRDAPQGSWEIERLFLPLHTALIGLALTLIGFSSGEREVVTAGLASGLGLALLAVWARWSTRERVGEDTISGGRVRVTASATRSIFLAAYVVTLAAVLWLLVTGA